MLDKQTKEKISTLESVVKSNVYRLGLSDDYRVEVKYVANYDKPIFIILPTGYEF